MNLQTLQTYRNHIIAYGILVLVIAGLGLYVKDLVTQTKALQAENQTAKVEYAKLGASYQTQGALFTSTQQASQAALEAFGKDLTVAMANQKATMQALYTALGRIESQTNAGNAVVVNPNADGSFAATLPQTRKGPGLSEVSLVYNPKESDPTKRLSSNWLSYREDFTPSVGEWKEKDGSYVGSMRLTRKVYRPDGSGNYTEVGTEEVPLVNATATFSPNAFGGSQVLAPVPRLTVFGGPGQTDKKKIVPVLGMDFRWTRKVGTGIGIAGNVKFVTLSYRIGN